MYNPPANLVAPIEQPDNEVGSLAMETGKDPAQISQSLNTTAETKTAELPIDSKIALASKLSKGDDPFEKIKANSMAEGKLQAQANEQPFTEQQAMSAEMGAMNDAIKKLPAIESMSATSSAVSLDLIEGAIQAFRDVTQKIEGGDMKFEPVNDSLEFIGEQGVSKAQQGMQQKVASFSDVINALEWQKASKMANKMGLDTKDVRVLDVGYEDFMTQKEIDIKYREAMSYGVMISGEPVSKEYIDSLVEQVKGQGSFRFLPDAVWQELRASPELYSVVSKESKIREIGLEDRTGKREYHEYLIDHFLSPIAGMAGSAIEGLKNITQVGMLNDKPTVDDDPIRHNTYKFLDRAYAERDEHRNIVKHIFDQSLNGSHDNVDQLYRHIRDNFDKLPTDVWVELNRPRVRDVMELGIDEGKYRQEGLLNSASKSLKRIGTKDSEAERVDSLYEYSRIGAGAIGSAVGFLLPSPVFSFGGKALAYSAALAKAPVVATKVMKLHKASKMAKKGTAEYAQLTKALNSSATKFFPAHGNVAKVSYASGLAGIGATGVAVHRTEASDRANQSFASQDQKQYHMDVSYLIGMSEIIPLGRFAPNASWVLGKKLSITTKDGAVIRGASDLSRNRVFSGVIDRAKSATKSAIEETIQESATNMFHNVLESGYNKDIQTMDGLMDAAIGGSIAGGFLGFIMPGKGIRRMSFDKAQIAKQSKGVQAKAEKIEKFVNDALDTIGSVENMGSTQENTQQVIETVAQLLDGMPETDMTQKLGMAIIGALQSGKPQENKETLKGFFESVVALGVIAHSTDIKSTTELVEALGSVKHILTPDAQTRNLDPELLEAALKVNPSGMVRGLYQIVEQLAKSDKIKDTSTDNIHASSQSGGENSAPSTPNDGLSFGDTSGAEDTSNPLGGQGANPESNTQDPTSTDANPSASPNGTNEESELGNDKEFEDQPIEYTDENGKVVSVTPNQPTPENNAKKDQTKEHSKNPSKKNAKESEGSSKEAETPKPKAIDVESVSKTLNIKSLVATALGSVKTAFGAAFTESDKDVLEYYKSVFMLGAKKLATTMSRESSAPFLALANRAGDLQEHIRFSVMQLLNDLFINGSDFSTLVDGIGGTRVFKYLSAVKHTLDANPRATVLIVAPRAEAKKYLENNADALEFWGLDAKEYADRIQIVDYEYLATLGRNTNESLTKKQRQKSQDAQEQMASFKPSLVVYDTTSELRTSKDRSDAISKEKARTYLKGLSEDDGFKTIYTNSNAGLTAKESAHITMLAADLSADPTQENLDALRQTLSTATGLSFANASATMLRRTVADITVSNLSETTQNPPKTNSLVKVRDMQTIKDQAKEALAKLFNSTFWFNSSAFKGVDAVEKLEKNLNLEVITEQELEAKGIEINDGDVYVLGEGKDTVVAKVYIIADRVDQNAVADVVLPLIARRVIAFALGYSTSKKHKDMSMSAKIAMLLSKPMSAKQIGEMEQYGDFIKALDALADNLYETAPSAKKVLTADTAKALSKKKDFEKISDKHLALMRWMFGAVIKEDSKEASLQNILDDSSVSSQAIAKAVEQVSAKTAPKKGGSTLDSAVRKVYDFLSLAKTKGFSVGRTIPKDTGKAIVSEPVENIGKVSAVKHTLNDDGSSYITLNWGSVGLKISFPSDAKPFEKTVSIEPTKNKKVNASLKAMATKDKSLNMFRKGLEKFEINSRDLADSLSAYGRSDNFHSSAMSFVEDFSSISHIYPAKGIESVHRISVPNNNSVKADGSAITGAKSFVKYYKIEGKIVVAPKGEMTKFNVVNALATAMHITEIEGRAVINFPLVGDTKLPAEKVVSGSIAMVVDKDDNVAMMELKEDVQEDTSKHKCDLSKRMVLNG